MKFSLLTPPTEVASRIPVRGVPNAAAMAVNTSGMPRILPQAEMDVGAAALPYQALARFAATGGQVAGETLGIVLHAEAAKRNAQNTADAEIISNAAQIAFDRKVKALEVSETQETFLPKVDEAYREMTTAALGQAKNDDVRTQVGVRMSKVGVLKGAEAATVNRGKIIKFHTGVLEQETINYIDRASDLSLGDAERADARNGLITLHTKYAAQGIIDPDVLVPHLEKSLTTIAVRSANGELTKDPETFYKSGWEKYKGQLPADDLTKLREASRGMYYGRLSDEAARVNANDKTFTEREKMKMADEASSLQARLNGLPPSPGVPHSPVSDNELSEFTKRYQFVMTVDERNYWATARAKQFRDGPVNPTLFRERRYELYTGKADLGTLQQDRLHQRMSEGENQDLMKLATEMANHQTIPNYQAGKAQIHERLGLNELNWLAGVVPMFKMPDQLKLRAIMADALAEYEQRVSSYPGGAVELGKEIGLRVAKDQFGPVLDGMGGGMETGEVGKKTTTPGGGLTDAWNRLKQKFGWAP